MTAWVFDSENMRPKRIQEGAGISLLETPDAIQFLFTGTVAGAINGTGTAQQVAYFVTGSTLGGDANLTFDGANLNIGGDVRAGGEFFPNNDQGRVEYRNITLASGTATVLCNTNKPYGFVFVAETAVTGEMAILSIHGGANTVTEISDLSASYGTLSGVSDYSIYYSAGNNRYEIGNNTGTSKTFRIMILILTNG